MCACSRLLLLIAVVLLGLLGLWKPEVEQKAGAVIGGPTSVQATRDPVAGSEPVSSEAHRSTGSPKKLVTKVEHTIIEQIAEAEYQFTRRGRGSGDERSGYFAPNRSQQLQSFFDRDGLTVRP